MVCKGMLCLKRDLPTEFQKYSLLSFLMTIENAV